MMMAAFGPRAWIHARRARRCSFSGTPDLRAGFPICAADARAVGVHRRAVRFPDAGLSGHAVVALTRRLERYDAAVEPLSVIVVEDMADVREVLVAAFRCFGHGARGVATAEEALALVRGGEPADVVFADQVLPNMRGHELAIELARTGRADVPVVLFTGGELDSPSHGITWLRKPIDFDVLRRVCEAVAHGHVDRIRPLSCPCPICRARPGEWCDTGELHARRAAVS